MKKVDEINSIMEEYYNLLKEIDDRNKNLKLAKFISSKRIESINTANEELKQENKELLKIELEKLNTNLEKILKDLEQEYNKTIEEQKEHFKKQEEELINKFDESNIKFFDSQSEIEHLKQLNETPDFKNVDIRQIINLKLKNTKELSLLKFMLIKEINQSEKDLEKEQLRETLNRIEECLKLMELTTEEKEVLMMPITEEELIECKLRNIEINLMEDYKAMNQHELSEIKENNIETTENITENKTTTQSQTLDEIFITEKDIISTRNRTSLLKIIYNKLIKGVNSLSSIKLDYSDNRHAKVSLKTSQEKDYIEQDGFLELNDAPIELTEGEYLNKEKIIESLKILANNYRYTTFITKDTNKQYIILSKDISKLISKLEKFTALHFLKGIGLTSDPYIIYGQQSEKDIFIGSANYNVNLSYGHYISNDELIYELNKVIVDKKLEKLKKLSSKLKRVLHIEKKYRSKHDAINEMLSNENVELANEHVLRK